MIILHSTSLYRAAIWWIRICNNRKINTTQKLHALFHHVYVISKELRTILLEVTIANAQFTLFLWYFKKISERKKIPIITEIGLVQVSRTALLAMYFISRHFTRIMGVEDFLLKITQNAINKC